LCFVTQYAIETVEVQLHIFLTSALYGGEWSVSRPGRFKPGGRSSDVYWIGGWVGPTAGLDVVEKRKICCLCRESNHKSSVDQFTA
jgi:hypothetical protein